ncbi:MAG: 2-hydroxyacyl-CoA dehydratase subunit D [bacterium]
MGSEIERSRQERIQELKVLRSQGQKIIGYFCQYVPVEMIHAAGAIPVRLARADYSSSLRGERFLRPDACPFCKSCLGKFETDPLYQMMDALIFVNTCDMMRRLPETLLGYRKIPIFQLYLPRTSQPFPNRLQEFERQLTLLSDYLTALTGKNCDEAGLIKAIEDYNHLRTMFTQLDNARSAIPLQFKGSEIIDLVALCSLLSPQQAEDLLNSKLYKLQELPKPESPIRPRLLLAGSILAEEDREVVQLLEAQADIVADALCTGARFFAGRVQLDDAPLKAIAVFYFSRIPCAYRRPNDLLYENLQVLIRERTVQGVIYKTLLYCDPWRFEAKQLRQMLKLPVIEIEGDYSCANREQLRTRIEAFLETLNLNHSL